MGKLFERSLSRWRGLSAVQKVVVCAAVVCVTLWGGSKSNGANRAQRMHVDEADAATNTTAGVDGVTFTATNRFRIVQADVSTNGFRVEAVWTNGHFGAGTVLDWHVATNLSPVCWKWRASDEVIDGVTNVARLFAFPDSAPSNASFFVTLTARTPATDLRDTDGDAIPDIYEWHHGTNPYVPDADLVPKTVVNTETGLVAALTASAPYEVIALASDSYALTQTVHMPAHPVLLMGDADAPAILYSTASLAAFMFSRGQSAQTVVQNLRLVLDVPDNLQVGFWCGGNLPWTGLAASPTFRNVHIRMPHAGGYYYGWLVYRGGAEPLELSSCSVNAAGARTRAQGICAHNPPPLTIANCSFLNFPTNSVADVAGIVLKTDDLATRYAATTNDLAGIVSNTIPVKISDTLFDGSFAAIHPLARFEDGAPFMVTVRNSIAPTGFREGHEPNVTNVLHVGDAGVTWCGVPRTNALAVVRGIGAFAPFAGDATVDSDGDGLTDANEIYALGTDPLFADSDFDSIDDATEIALGVSPSDNASFPCLLTVKVENAETYAGVTNYIAWGVSPTAWETNGLSAFTEGGGSLVYSNLVVSGDLYVKCFRDLNTNGVYDADWDILLEQVVSLCPRPFVPLAFGDVDHDGVTDLEERLDGTDPYDARNFRLRATLRVTDLDAGNGVTNLLAITQEEGDWNPAEVCAASTRDSFDYAVDIVATSGVVRVNGLHDRIGNRDVDSEQERVKSVVLTASSQGRVMSFSVGDSDGDGVPDTREINEGTSPVDVKNFRLRATLSITDVDVGHPVTNYVAMAKSPGTWATATGRRAFVGGTLSYPVDVIVTNGCADVWCLRDFGGGLDAESPDCVLSRTTLTKANYNQKLVLKVGDCDGDGVPDGDERDEGTDARGYTNYCFRLMATITRIFAPGGSNLTAVATFGSSTNVVYGPCVQSNDTLTVDFGHLATTSGARVSFTFWEDLDGDGVHSAHERATTWWPPLTGHAVCVTNELSFGMFDRDNDGMLDDWEIQYGLSPTTSFDAVQDPDGDGLVNLHEYWLKYDPFLADGSNTVLSLAARSVDGRINGHDAATGLSRFVEYQTNGLSTIFIPNTNFWARSVDLSCASMWNSATNDIWGGPCSGWQMGGTAISPRHVLCAQHYGLPTGTRLYFMTTNQTVVSRTVLSSHYVATGSDLRVCLLDSELPADVRPVPILPDDYARHIGSARYLPLVTLEQEEKLVICESGVLQGPAKREVDSDGSLPRVGTRSLFYEPIIGGDSGSPRFCILGNQVVLLYLIYHGGSGGGRFVTHFRDDIQSAMDALCPGYEIQEVDLSTYEVIP